MKRDSIVHELVEKYRREYPFLERPLLRKLLRSEHRDVFPELSGKLRTLDRELKRSYKLQPSSLLSLYPKFVKERMRILGVKENPELFDFQHAFEMEIIFGRSAEEAKKNTLKLYKAHQDMYSLRTSNPSQKKA